MKIEVEKGVPVPEDRYTRRGKYPWREMEVGDSFFVNSASLNSLTSCRAGAKRQTGWDFTMRRVDGGVRVWRIK